MQQLAIAIDTDSAPAIVPGIIDQPVQQQAMSSEQIGLPLRLPARHGVIGGKGIAHLLDFAW